MESLTIVAVSFIMGFTLAAIFYKSSIKRVRKANAMLMNESDYYCLKSNILWRKMHPVVRRELLDGIELKTLDENYKRNQKSIEKTGVY